MKTFSGSACSVCGGTERYKSSHNCVNCAKRNATKRYEQKIGGEPPRRASAISKAQAVERGEKTYQGPPCPRGHTGIRYVVNSLCTECMRLKWHLYPSVRIRLRAYKNRPEQRLKANALGKAWREKNPEKCSDSGAQKRARRLRATPKWSDPAARMFFYKLARRLTKETGTAYHVDHIIPLKSNRVCGLHCEANLQVIPATENMQKHNSWWPDM